MGQKKVEAKEKPLDKMTAIELRTLAKEVAQVSGVYGMNKPELIAAIQKARGIEVAKGTKSDASVREMKARIRVLKKEREAALAASDAPKAAIFRKRISRLKKKTRNAG
jgi:hypothetical protein